MSWAGRRRAVYLGGVLIALAIVLGVPLFFVFYTAPTCSDGKNNGNELGIDCGGACAQLCDFQGADPIVLWSRAFEVAPGRYSAVAYIENPNPTAAVEDIRYQFRLLDADNALVAERPGKTAVLPGRITPVFESDLIAGDRIPIRTFFEFTEEPQWVRAVDRSAAFSVESRSLERSESNPRLNVELANESLDEFDDLEVVAVVFGTDGNAVAASQTIVERFPKRATQDLVFTWPRPFPKRIEACVAPADIALLLDVSGSMNDQGGVPPQPITDAKEAAVSFVDRLDSRDRISVIPFATQAEVRAPLSILRTEVRLLLETIAIRPEEERGFTNVGDAVDVARSELNSERRNPEARSFAVLLTDGRANAPRNTDAETYALTRANEAKNDGVVFYAIGLGAEVNESFLRSIAGSTERTFLAATSNELDAIYGEVSTSICERGPAIIDVIPKGNSLFEAVGN